MKELYSLEVADVSVTYASDELTSDINKAFCHERYELLYVVSGKGRCVIDGTEYPLSPRTLFITAPFEYKSIYIDGEGVFSRYTISFSSSSVMENSLDILNKLLNAENPFHYLAIEQNSLIDSIFDRFFLADFLAENEKEPFLTSLLTGLVILLSAASRESFLAMPDTLSSKISRYINANIQRDLSLDSLSRRFFVNKHYLCRTFKEQTGISLHNYINRKRVLYAIQLIESGETASQAAEKVGFCDYSAFYRASVRLFGAAPTLIKNKAQKNY